MPSVISDLMRVIRKRSRTHRAVLACGIERLRRSRRSGFIAVHLGRWVRQPARRAAWRSRRRGPEQRVGNASRTGCGVAESGAADGDVAHARVELRRADVGLPPIRTTARRMLNVACWQSTVLSLDHWGPMPIGGHAVGQSTRTTMQPWSQTIRTVICQRPVVVSGTRLD
jgi:hypothetical protein